MSAIPSADTALEQGAQSLAPAGLAQRIGDRAVADAASIGECSSSFPPVALKRKTTARRLILTGRVQGIGVRPAIARLASACHVSGVVANRKEGVEITIEGRPDRIDQFVQRLRANLPSAARVDSVVNEECPPAGLTRFAIATGDDTGPLQTQVPTDLAVCSDCLAEIADQGNRRQIYPFTSCTNCGPRYSILQAMPYERAGTGMSRFELCPACHAEYTSPGDRRFHAQTNACPACGPHVWACDRDSRTIAHRGDAITTAIKAILDGMIVAIRGLGGYQLACDAASNAAVSRLRDRKHRATKPLAVMVEDLSAADRLSEVDGASREALVAAENPIVLVAARPGNGLAAAIHPGLDTVGLMLPTTPLHWLLVHGCRRPLVMTSGNREGEPLLTEPVEAEVQLREIADLWLHHDRPILRPLDDSVVRVIAGRAVTLRLARGMAPLSLDLPGGLPALAVGGHQKSTFALANGSQAILASHVGDLDTVASRERYLSQVTSTTGLYGAAPQLWIHDLHPDYFTTRWARAQPGTCLTVQHHHAHVAAAMLEHDWLDREVLGVAFDGTGFSPDGTIWGGEFLLTTATGFRRVAHLRPFRLPGGEAAIREPWRVAVALLYQAAGDKDLAAILSGFLPRSAAEDANPKRKRGRLSAPSLALRVGMPRWDWKSILPLLENDRFSPRMTSAGRLFDGVAALVLDIHHADFEGAPAMLLESAVDRNETGSYSFPITPGTDSNPHEIDWRPMVRELLADLTRDVPRGTIAMRFHRGLAGAIAEMCRRFAPHPVVLSGGVFQNRVLTERVAESLSGSGQPLGLPGRIPPNDGGLAAGQLAVGLSRAAQLRKGDVS